MIQSAPRPDKPELTKEKFLAAFQALSKSVGEGGAKLIPEIILYQRSAKDERAVWDSEFLLTELVRDLKKRQIIDAVSPYLDAEDAKIRRRMFNLMDRACSGPPAINFRPIFSLRPEDEGKFSDGLVKYMFKTSPGDALTGFMRFHKTHRKEILWAEHAVSDAVWKYQYGFLDLNQPDAAAVEQLDKLSRYQEWWARLYVAEILQRHPALQSAETVKRLKQDPNLLVRKTMSSVK